MDAIALAKAQEANQTANDFNDTAVNDQWIPCDVAKAEQLEKMAPEALPILSNSQVYQDLQNKIAHQLNSQGIEPQDILGDLSETVRRSYKHANIGYRGLPNVKAGIIRNDHDQI
ncbi:uncharacterized protein BdWA1_003736 [Babesia duncani]|nr:hypothetical protein BdWA1_003736 [Babesia duncani]